MATATISPSQGGYGYDGSWDHTTNIWPVGDGSRIYACWFLFSINSPSNTTAVRFTFSTSRANNGIHTFAYAWVNGFPSTSYIKYGDAGGSDGTFTVSGTGSHTVNLSSTSGFAGVSGDRYLVIWGIGTTGPTAAYMDIVKDLSQINISYDYVDTHTVYFNANGGTGAPGNQTKVYGSTLYLTTQIPSRTGYDFQYWCVNSDGSGTIYYPGGAYNADQDITLYAIWAPTTYTITFNANGGTGGPGSRTKTHDIPLVMPFEVPSRSNYEFICCNTQSNGSGTNFYPGGPFTINANTTLYAVWRAVPKYTITYDANGGTGAPASQTKTQGQSIQLSNTKPTRNFIITYDANGGSISPSSKSVACNFITWNTRSDGSGTSYSPGSIYNNDADVTLYAIWGYATAGSLPTPTRTNCQFHMWTTTLNGSIQVTSSTQIYSNTTIYAKWRYAIIFDGNGGIIQNEDTKQQASSFTVYKTHGVTLVIPNYYAYRTSSTSNPDDSDDSQYTSSPSSIFLGWNISSSATSAQYVEGGSFTANNPARLYAIYQTKTYTVIFTDGYSGTVLRQYNNVPQGSSVQPPPDPVREGFTFSGWLGNYTNIMENTTIEAFWGFTPIWIRRNNKWMKYEPKEDI